MRYRELLEYKREITITNLGDKFLQRMRNDETLSDYFSDGGLESEEGKPYSLDQELVRKFVTSKIWQIEEADPSPNKQYVQWMILRYIDGSINLFEDIVSTVSEMLDYFHKLKMRRQLPPELMDINKFKGRDVINKLDDTVHRLWSEHQKKRGEETELALPKGDAQQLYNDANVRVIIPKNKDAACYYGQGTKWCTASTKSRNYFDEYNSRGRLYIFIPKNPTYEGEKYQLHDDGTFLNEKDMEVISPKGPMYNGLKWLLYERFPSEELRDFFIKLDNVITTDSVKVTSPGNAITATMFGFPRGVSKKSWQGLNLILTPTNPRNKGEQYRVRSGTTGINSMVLDKHGRSPVSTQYNLQAQDDISSLRWLLDERFPDKELKDKFINPTEVYKNNEVRVVKPQNALSNLYYSGDSAQHEALFIFEPINPVHDGEEYKINSDGKLLNEKNAEIKDGVQWMFDERFPTKALKDKFVEIDDVYESNEVYVGRPKNYIARRYMGDYSRWRGNSYDMFIPKNPKSENERYMLNDQGTVVSPDDTLPKSINWLFDTRFPDEKLKEEYIHINKNVFDNDEVSVDMTDPERGYFAKLYHYPTEYPPEGTIYIINPKQPSEDGEKYRVVIGSTEIYDKENKRFPIRELFTKRFKDESLFNFINKDFNAVHETNISDTIDFVPSNVLDDTLSAIGNYVFEYVDELVDEMEMNDDYYQEWLIDSGYINADGEYEDDAPSYIDYDDDVRMFVNSFGLINEINMGDINDVKSELRDEDGILHLSELPEVVETILKDNSRVDSRSQWQAMDEVYSHLNKLIIRQEQDKNGRTTGVSVFSNYKDSDGNLKRTMHLEKSYEV